MARPVLYAVSGRLFIDVNYVRLNGGCEEAAALRMQRGRVLVPSRVRLSDGPGYGGVPARHEWFQELWYDTGTMKKRTVSPCAVRFSRVVGFSVRRSFCEVRSHARCCNLFEQMTVLMALLRAPGPCCVCQ